MAYREFDEFSVSRRSLLRGGGLLGLGAMASLSPLSARLARAHETMDWPAVQAMLDEYAGTGKVANIVAALGYGTNDPRFLAKGTLALNGSVAADADSLYRVYSMTKPVTGMAAMMLIDDGKLGLDQPLAEILPAFANMMVQKEYDGSIEPDNLEPAERPITIRQLLTHTAGLGYNIVQQGPINQYYAQNGLTPAQISRLPLPGAAPMETASSLASFADKLAEAPLVYQPGTRWSYSVALDLLGRVIEVAGQMPFDAFLETRIFEPAGMTSTWFTVPESEVGRLTTNYYSVGGRMLPVDPAASSVYLDNPAFPFGGAGLVSSPRDYDRFLKMLLNYGMIDGRRVMGELAVRVGTSNLLPETVDLSGSWVAGQGFGAGGRVQMKAGQHAYGWGGAAGTAAFVDFAKDLRASLFTQYMPSSAYPIQEGFPIAVEKDVAAAHGL